MYERIAEYIEDVRPSLRIDVSDHVYRRCMDELRSLCKGKFDRVTQSMENLRALVDQLQSRLALVEDSRLNSPVDYREGRSERPASSRRPDAQPFPSAEQMIARAHMTAELNSTRRRVREVEQTSTARLPGAPTRGPGASVPPNASETHELPPTGTVTSRHADGIRPPMDASVASETQALPYAAGGIQEGRRVPYADEPDRGGAARRSRELILSFDPRWGGYQPVDLTAHPGPVDIRTLPVTPFGTLGPAAPGVEPVHTMIQEFSDVANYRMYRLDNTSRLVTPGDAGRIAKYVQRCRGIRPKMRSFDGTDAIQLLPFLKDIRITFNAQHQTEGVAVRVFAHFLERDAERLYMSYTMRGLRAGQLHDDISWPGLVNQFIKRYLTDDVLGEAYDAVATARQQPHETENAYADRLESAAFRGTAVFTEQALAHYFVRGLALATRTAVAETFQRLPGSQKTDLSSIRRIATAEGTKFRARRGMPLPDPKRAGRTGRPSRSNATISPATALHIGEDEGQADPVLIARGMVQRGGRPCQLHPCSRPISNDFVDP